jgi:hypothetical protein
VLIEAENNWPYLFSSRGRRFRRAVRPHLLQQILANHLLTAAATERELAGASAIGSPPHDDLGLATRFRTDINVVFSQIHGSLLISSSTCTASSKATAWFEIAVPLQMDER